MKRFAHITRARIARAYRSLHIAAMAPKRLAALAVSGRCRNTGAVRKLPEAGSASTAAIIARLVVALIGLFPAGPLQAVLFHSTGDPEYNTTAPTNTLEGSGWQFQGSWGAYLGTPVSSNLFLTAQHLGGTVGNFFFLFGNAYHSTVFFDDPESDLRLVRVCGSFPAAATLHTHQAEFGKNLVVFGRGTRRGEPVTSGPANTKTNGWRWGLFDSQLRWGENVVEAVVDGNALFGTGVGDLLKVTFDANAGPNECHLSVGDSGGGLFILDGESWQLAGINFSVDGPYRSFADGSEFSAAIFDEGGLYTETSNGWTLVPDRPFPQPGAFYATRVGSRIDWIQSVLEQVADTEDPPILQAAQQPAGPYADNPSATVDALGRTVTIPRPLEPQFYRLRACRAFRITHVELQPENLLIRYN